MLVVAGDFLHPFCVCSSLHFPLCYTYSSLVGSGRTSHVTGGTDCSQFTNMGVLHLASTYSELSNYHLPISMILVNVKVVIGSTR
jgi:hypothetical protein